MLFDQVERLIRRWQYMRRVYDGEQTFAVAELAPDLTMVWLRWTGDLYAKPERNQHVQPEFTENGIVFHDMIPDGPGEQVLPYWCLRLAA